MSSYVSLFDLLCRETVWVGSLEDWPLFHKTLLALKVKFCLNLTLLFHDSKQLFWVFLQNNIL
jgi:hypothetical protein